MEAGEKDCEEETLQMAFKKLRVDAESSLPGNVNVSEAQVPRAVPRTCPEASGAKPKLGCAKDTWHGCARKSSRGVSRTQRRRRSKSPILHPPKFTYCSPATASSARSPPSGCLKHQRLAGPEAAEPGAVDGRPPSALAPLAQTSSSLAATSSSSSASPPVFGACAGVNLAAATSPPLASPGEVLAAGASGEPSDFHTLSRLHRGGSPAAGPPRAPCSCPRGEGPDDGENAAAVRPGCRCQSAAVEVYSFTGLRDDVVVVVPEHQRTPPAPGGGPRTLSAAAANGGPASVSPLSGAPRSCSEQARAYVDDITIEDLSGYMEYFLYIPKKMSHMAEMMYT